MPILNVLRKIQISREVRPRSIGLFVLLLLIVVTLWPYMIRVPTMDENLMIYEGFSVARGQVPYRDFFEFIWPGTFFLTALIVKLFGPSLFLLRLLALGALLLCGWITLRLGKNFLSPPWLWALGILFGLFNLPINMQINHHLLSAAAGLLAVWFSFQNLNDTDKSVSKWKLFLSGLFCGLCFCFTQSLGICLGMTLFLFWSIYLHRVQQANWQKLLKQMTVFGGGVALPLLSVCLFFLSIGAWKAFIDDTFLWLLEGHYQQTTDAFYFKEGFLKMVKGGWREKIILPLNGALPLLGILWPLDIFAKRRLNRARFNHSDWRLFLIWLSSLGFMLATFSYPTSSMIIYHGWLPYLLSFIILFTLLKQKTCLLKWLTGVLITLVIFLWGQQLKDAYQLFQNKRAISYGTVEKELTSTLPEVGITAYRVLTYWIHEHTPPGEELFIYNLAPEFYILTDRQNPTRYNYLMAVYNTPQQIEEAARELHTKLPKYVLYNHLDTIFFAGDFRFAKFRNYDYRLKPIEAVLKRNYRLLTQFGPLWLYEVANTHQMQKSPAKR